MSKAKGSPSHKVGSCEICGKTKYDAPIATRWLRGMGIVACGHCWSRRGGDLTSEFTARFDEWHDALSEATKKDLVEGEVALTKELSWFGRRGLRGYDDEVLPAAIAEHRRVTDLAQNGLPHWRLVRAARAARLDDVIPTVNEWRKEVAPYAAVERDEYARSLFAGFSATWDAPEEIVGWFFDSAAAGEWLPPRDDAGALRASPRLGANTDVRRLGCPPSMTWGRSTDRKERGTGKWVTAANRRRGWSKSRKKPALLELASKQSRELTAALIGSIEKDGLPRKHVGAPLDRLDYEELKFRLHVRLCEWCGEESVVGGRREFGRSDHQFSCVDASGRESSPLLSWIHDELDRPWNQDLLFHAGISSDPVIRTDRAACR